MARIKKEEKKKDRLKIASSMLQHMNYYATLIVYVHCCSSGLAHAAALVWLRAKHVLERRGKSELFSSCAETTFTEIFGAFG